MKNVLFWILTISPIISYSQILTQNYNLKATKIIVTSKENFTSKTDSILQVALVLAEGVINSERFEKIILQAQFVNTKDCSNNEILKLIHSGYEIWKPVANDTIELQLGIYPDQNGNNIGSTWSSKKITTSEKYLLKNGAPCYAAHLIHEYCHTIGYDNEGFTHIHNTNGGRRKEKCSSVPYVIGEIARKLLNISTCHFECEF